MVSRHLSFVNISRPDQGQSKRTKALVRRHVMADVGRSRRKKAKYKIIPLQVAATDTSSDTTPTDAAAVESLPLVRMPPSFQTFLIGSDARASELITFMTAEADYVYRPFRASWFRIGLSDTAAFDLWLAQAVVIRNGLLHEPNASNYDAKYLDTSEASRYYCKSLHQLALRLNSREDCMSDGVIATIMGFICVDTRVENWDRYTVHMDGLERIYHLRHGFDALDSEIPLMTFWVDLMGASMLDRYPRFPIPKQLARSQRINQDDIPQALRTLLDDAEEAVPQGGRIYAMLRMMAPVVAMANRNTHNTLFWTEPAAMVEILGIVSHFVLSLPKCPEDDTETDGSVFVVQRMVQLACLMIISELKRLASFHWADIGPLCDRFTTLLQQRSYQVPAGLKKLRLWAIVTAYSLARPETRDSLLVEARQSIADLGIHSSEELAEHMKDILWLENINPIIVECFGIQQLAIKTVNLL
ncbi:hypothetical protein ACQKWADRAFT_294466 [Trichoderma austrokoningii]